MIKSGLPTNPMSNAFLHGGKKTNGGGLLFQWNNTALPTPDSTSRAIGWQDTTLKSWNGTGWTEIGGTSGSSTWDSIYAGDKTLTIDGTTFSMALTHTTGDGLTLTGSSGSAGQCIQITNSGSGDDIQGTSDTWAVTKAGLATFTGIDGCDALTAAASLTLEATSTGTISIGATSSGAIDIGTGTGAVTVASLLTAAVGLVVTTVGILSSDGIVDIVDNANNASTLRVTNDTQTDYGNASDAGMVVLRSESLTTGALLHLSLDETNLAGGDYLRAWSQDDGVDAFTIKEYGLTTIKGVAAGTDALILTTGDILLTAGHIDMTVGDFTMADGSITVTDADDGASLSVTNSTATTASVIAFAGSGVHTGTTTTSWMTLTPSGMAAGTGLYAVFAGLTTGKGIHVATDATQTTGSALYVQNTGASSAMTSGTVATFDHTATGIATSVNKIGSVVSVTSNRTVTTSGTTADDFDLLSIIKTTARPAAGTAATAGSALYVQVATSGTVTETSHGIELIMDSGGSGSGIEITHAATDGKALDVIGASTSVDDVLITGSGAHTSNLATLQVTNSGNTAAAGSIVRVTQSGTPTATSYLAEFTNEHATVSSNPMLVQMNGHTSTNAVLNITSAGTNTTGLAIITSTNAGANGAILAMHTLGGSQATNDYVAQLLFGGQDDAGTPAGNEYGAIKCQVNDETAGTEDGRLELWACVGGTNTELFAVESTSAGAKDCEIKTATCTLDGSAAATAAFTITNGDIAISAGGIATTTTADMYGLDITVNQATATQGVAVFTNASTTSGTHVLEIEQADVDEPYMKFSGSTAVTSAGAGSNGDVPAQVVGYLLIDVDGTDRKVPYYATA